MDISSSFPTLVFELLSSILPAQGNYSGNIHSRGINPIFCGQTSLLSFCVNIKYFENVISEDNFHKFAKCGTYHKEFVALFHTFLSSGINLTIHLG